MNAAEDQWAALRVPTSELRWRFDPKRLPFQTTDEVDPADSIVGQDDALEALEFGLRCDAPGQNIYIRGVRGTGRLTMVRRLLKQLNLKTDGKLDRCYVHNFERPDRPRLIELPPGQGPLFAKRMKELAEFVGKNLRKNFESEPLLSQRRMMEKDLSQKVRDITGPLEKELDTNNLAMVQMQQGPATQTAIVPVINKQPIPAEQLRELVDKGEVPPAVLETYERLAPQFKERLVEISRRVSEVYLEGRDRMQQFIETAAEQIMNLATAPILKKFSTPAVQIFLRQVMLDAIETQLTNETEDDAQVDLTERYGVNVVLTHDNKTDRAVVEEIAPTFINLMGTVEPSFSADGRPASDYRGIRGGALLRADRGYLILNVNDLVLEPGAWRSLMRTLRSGRLEMVPPEASFMRPYLVVQPESIEINVRVILIGEARLFYQLDQLDSDFRELFKVLVDMDDEIIRDQAGVMQYAFVVSRLVKEDRLPPFDASALARLAEHGCRIAARSGKLSSRFGRIEDIAREAAFLVANARQDEGKPNAKKIVTADEVTRAIARTKKRGGLPSRRFQEMVERRMIIVQTHGQEIGQINGLAVMQAGPLTYGFPARITATIGPGRAGIINIEGQAQMSGAIHTKGFHILGGLLRHLLHTDHPLAFSASLAFEQSYGGIDGDSASGAEIVCLLSSLTDIPIRQNMAMTGAIDQKGNLEAIGGANEKIEGFFDACNYFGLTGDQGVVIPQANAGDLMLREDVVQACDEGRFHVYAVDNIFHAMELMTGQASGANPRQPLHLQTYSAGTILGKAVAAAKAFWERTLASPTGLTRVETLQQAALDDHHPKI